MKYEVSEKTLVGFKVLLQSQAQNPAYLNECNECLDMSPTQTKFVSDFADSAKLAAFRDFFLAAVGPSGRSVAFESSVGYLTVTSTSNRMLRKAEPPQLDFRGNTNTFPKWK